jgi:hypothetical protein
MKIRVPFVCLCLLSTAVPLAWADASTKAAKIAELMQLTGARQWLHEVEGKVDQEEAARAWGRFYSENVTEGDLDAILAYYRSPAGQTDVTASRAALGQVQRYMADKRSRTAPAAATNSAQTAAGGAGPAAVRQSGAGVGSAGGSATTGAAAVGSPATDPAHGPETARAVGPASAVPATIAGRPWDRQPRAPDGRVVPSPALPEQCDMPPTPPPGSHAVPSSRSVVCVCTDEKGILTRDPVIAESSGDARVDSGAIKMARSDSGRYVPPTVEGHSQSACFRFAIDFSHPQ